MKTSLKILLAFAALVVAPVAFAGSTINPSNGLNAWDLYVMGNGSAVYHILHSIAMMMNNHVFYWLIRAIAVVAFVVLAVRAGFDFGKHGVRMFFYVIGIAIVVWAMGLRVNVTVNDKVTGYYNTAANVPALIGLPAAFTSQFGHYLTEKLEEYYDIPGALTLTGKGGQSGGTFGIFAKMMHDASKLKISNPGLQKSLSAYVSDCAVPAIALGRMHTTDLVRSTDLMQTLQAAASESHMTRYYPGETYVPGPGAEQGGSQPLTCAPGAKVQGQTGALLTCRQAYGCLQSAMADHAQALLNASAAQWSDTGVMTPLGTELGAALSWAEGGINAGVDTGSTGTTTYVKQQAMINAMTGAFRHAAMQTNNNEMLTDTAISQAEQNQRSFWASSAIVFGDMMGYVYSTLQAFIFAIAPVVILALFIPGFSFLMLKSYGQVLIWLALWEPMLSVINYLVALFGQQSIGAPLAQWGGLTMQNSWTISTQANDLTTAAAFLGTMTPLILWGLIKGSMAFTEYITHGVGAQYAAQAGAAMGSGNVGLNNMQMDNISTSKYNTASSIAVGDQGVNSFMGAGAVTTTFDYGGSTGKANAQTMSITRSHSTAQDIQEAKNHQAQIARGYTQQHSGVIQHVFGGNASINTLSSDMSNVTKNRNLAIAKKSGLSEDQLTDVAEIKALQAEGKTSEAKQMQAKVGLSTSQLSAGADALRQIANNTGLSASKTNNAGSKDSHADGLSSGATGSNSTARNDTVSGGKQQGDLTSAGWTAAGALAIASVANGSIGDSYSYIMGKKETTTQQLTMPQGFDPVAYETGGYAGEVAPLDVGNISAERRAAEEQILGRRAGADSRASAFEGRAETLYGNYGKPIADPNSTPRSSYDMYAPGSAANPASSSQSFAGKVDTGMTDRAKHREKIKAATDAASDKTRYSTDYNANRNTALFTKPTTNYKTGHIELDPNYYPGKKTAHTIAGGVQKGEETVVNTLGNIPTH